MTLDKGDAKSRIFEGRKSQYKILKKFKLWKTVFHQLDSTRDPVGGRFAVENCQSEF